jgi:hypothetical protein
VSSQKRESSADEYKELSAECAVDKTWLKRFKWHKIL